MIVVSKIEKHGLKADKISKNLYYNKSRFSETVFLKAVFTADDQLIYHPPAWELILFSDNDSFGSNGMASNMFSHPGMSFQPLFRMS